MKTFKIKHWNDGNIDITTIDADNEIEARYFFHVYFNDGDIIEVTEVETDD